MTNYYAELGLNRSASTEELEKQLNSLHRTWSSRASQAKFGSDGQRNAENKLQLIREASEILLIPSKRVVYDRDLDKSSTSSTHTDTDTSSQRQTSVDVDDIVGGAAFEDLAEQFYDSSNYRQAVAVIQKAMESGYYSIHLFRLLAKCNIETGNENAAFNVLQNMLHHFGDDAEAHRTAARICLQSLPGHMNDAKKSINWLINAGYGEEGNVVALDSMYNIENGEISLAEHKVKEYLSKHPNDQDFRYAMSYAFAGYADSQADAVGGSICFLSEESLDNWLKYTEKALEIFPDRQVQSAYNNNKALKEKTFVTSNWPGLVCGVFFTLAGFNDPKAKMLGLIALILTVFMTYTSFVPKWMFGYYEYKEKLCGIYEAGRIINIVCSILIRIVLWIWAFMWNLFLGFMRSM